jgi:hypothetical protein
MGAIAIDRSVFVETHLGAQRRRFVGGLSFGDGFKFGCGFQVAALLFGVGITILMVIVLLVLSILGVASTSILTNIVPG